MLQHVRTGNELTKVSILWKLRHGFTKLLLLGSLADYMKKPTVPSFFNLVMPEVVEISSLWYPVIFFFQNLYLYSGNKSSELSQPIRQVVLSSHR